MLKQVTLEGYRCFRRVKLEFPPDRLVVLIGPNGTGKTALLEALDLIARAVASEGGFAEPVALRGGLDQITTWNAKLPIKAVVRFSGEGHFEKDGGDIEYELVLGEREGHPAPAFERVDVLRRGNPPLRVAQQGSSGTWALNARTRQMDEISVPRGRSIVAAVSQAEFYPTLSHLRQWLRDLRVYGHFLTGPRFLLSSISERFDGPRSPAVPMQPERMDARAVNLQTVLLSLKSDDLPAWKRVVADFRLAFPFAEELDFMLVGGQMGLAVRFAGDSQLRPAASALSDGMLAWLALLTALATAPQGSLVALDEPEASLHPDVVRLLVGRVEVHAQTSGPVLLCTHADRILDHLQDPAACVRVLDSLSKTRELAETHLQELNSEDLAAWREKYTLSEMRARGLLDGGRT